MAVLPACAGWAADEPAGATSETALSLSNQVAVAAQWRPLTVLGAGYATVDIFLTHTGTTPIVFGRLAGTAADGAPDLAWETNVAWKRWYPTAELKPGGMIVAQANFIRTPRTTQRVRIEADGWAPLSVTLPPYREPDPLLEVLTLSADGRHLYVFYRHPRATPSAIWVNGREVVFRARRGGEGDVCDLAACDVPEAIAVGSTLHVKLRFKDGATAQGLVRAWRGLMLDAYLCEKPEERQALGLDAEPAVIHPKGAYQGDVACFDAKQATNGAAALAIEAERPALWAAQPGKLMALHYCKSADTELWNLYGALGDVALTSPYRLSHGADVKRFLDDEIALMERARLSVRPGYWMWIPDTFQRKQRFIEPDELRVLTWTALARGAKAVKYFCWRLNDPKQFGFERNPALTEAIAAQNALLRRWSDRLAPLAAMREETHGDARAGHAQYTAWSGEAGVLTVVRNLKYVTDGEKNAGGVQPRFRACPKTNVVVTLRVPSWLGPVRVEDVLTGAKLPAGARGPRGVDVTVPLLEAVSVLWAEPAEEKAPAAPVVEAATNATPGVVPSSVETTTEAEKRSVWQRPEVWLGVLLLLALASWVWSRRQRG